MKTAACTLSFIQSPPRNSSKAFDRPALVPCRRRTYLSRPSPPLDAARLYLPLSTKGTPTTLTTVQVGTGKSTAQLKLPRSKLNNAFVPHPPAAGGVQLACSVPEKHTRSGPIQAVRLLLLLSIDRQGNAKSMASISRIQRFSNDNRSGSLPFFGTSGPLNYPDCAKWDCACRSTPSAIFTRRLLGLEAPRPAWMISLGANTHPHRILPSNCNCQFQFPGLRLSPGVVAARLNAVI